MFAFRMAWGVLLVACASAACGGGGAAGPEPGFETGPCISGSCLGGLECLSDVCVLPAGDTTLVDVTTSASDGAETTTSAATDTGATTTLTTSASDTTASSVADTSSGSGPPQESSSEAGPAESDGGSTMATSSESSSTGGMPAPGAWEECEGVMCEAGNDCTTITGLGNAAFCSPQCMDNGDCPPPPDGDATPVCALVAGGADSATNCGLLCAYDGMDYGTCPAGMDCTELPDQMTPVSLCLWP